MDKIRNPTIILLKLRKFIIFLDLYIITSYNTQNEIERIINYDVK